MAKSDRPDKAKDPAAKAESLVAALESAQFHYKHALDRALGLGPDVGEQFSAALDRGRSGLRQAQHELDGAYRRLLQEADAELAELRTKVRDLEAENDRLRQGRKRHGRAPGTESQAFTKIAEKMLERGDPPESVMEVLIAVYRASGLRKPIRAAEGVLKKVRTETNGH